MPRILRRIHYNVIGSGSPLSRDTATRYAAAKRTIQELSEFMQRSTKSTVIVAALALAAFVTSFTATHRRARAPQAPPPAANTPPKPLVPVAASSVAANPDPYVGEYVTMTGAVEANLTKTSFSVDQDKTKATGKEVLVLAPTLQKQADANGYVTVIGQLIKFDEKEVAAKLKDYKIDLSAADVAKFKGKPVVLATAVINTAGIDIAKKPIPPMTADDLTLQKIMTKLPPAQAAVRKALDGKDRRPARKEQATLLKDFLHARSKRSSRPRTTKRPRSGPPKARATPTRSS